MKPILRRVLFAGMLGLSLLLSSCLLLLKPGKPFGAKPAPAAPDYALLQNWAALPSRHDAADTVPAHSNLRDEQAQAAADVFFVHPTTYFSRFHWNAALDEKLVNALTDVEAIRKQASVFNAAGRIYAPRYRQATFYTFFTNDSDDSRQALDLAYTDVKAAFAYYLAHHNQGRPIILAGHSQGTILATRLLHEFFDQNPALRRQLVAAYLIGYKVPATFQVLQPCADSTQTGCYLSWNSVQWRKPFPRFEGGVAVNPLTWTTDTAYVPAARNPGSVPAGFNRIEPGIADARVHDGLVWLHPPQDRGYTRVWLPFHLKLHRSFHLADYGPLLPEPAPQRRGAGAGVSGTTNE